MSLQISIFEILSCSSCFLGFSANVFLRFHFVLQKPILFRTLRNSNIIFAITNSAHESVHLLRSVLGIIRWKFQAKFNKIITNVVNT
jgi:hypothetical protein